MDPRAPNLFRLLFGGWQALSWLLIFLPKTEPWVPRPCVFCKGGSDAADIIGLAMSPRLQRFYGAHPLHFITCSCFRRRPLLRGARQRDTFLRILYQVRQRYRFVVVGYVVVGYVVMPEHIHLLLGEPEVGTPSTVMQVLKQRSARALLPRPKKPDARQIHLFAEAPSRTPLWQARFYDFNLWTARKRVEKLRYMHQNPVQRELVRTPEDWRWTATGSTS